MLYFPSYNPQSEALNCTQTDVWNEPKTCETKTLQIKGTTPRESQYNGRRDPPMYAWN